MAKTKTKDILTTKDKGNDGHSVKLWDGIFLGGIPITDMDILLDGDIDFVTDKGDKIKTNGGIGRLFED